MSSGALSVDNSLGNTLTSEMSKLVEEVEVLGEDGSATPRKRPMASMALSQPRPAA